MLKQWEKLSKRLLTLVLAALVIFSMAGFSSVPAQAAEDVSVDDITEDAETVEQENDTDAVEETSLDVSVEENETNVTNDVTEGENTETTIAADIPMTVSEDTEPAATDAGLNGGSRVNVDGTYTLAEGATGKITIGENLNVTIEGGNYNAEKGEFGNPYSDLSIIVGNNSILTIKDLYVNVAEDANPIIDFQGKGKLNISGHNLLDRPDGYGNGATIHVGADADVIFDGDGYLWGYKHAAGAFIGSNANEVCGNITFNGGTWLMKASKTGALIGQDSSNEATGKITINGGTIYLKAVARGSLIGASAQGKAPEVVVNGGQLELVTDFSGAAIGSATPANAGTLTVNGGSIRTIVTQNAYSAWGIDAETNKGAVLSDANITAEHNTAMLAFDATDYATANSINVYFDGDQTPFYTGGLYEFCTNEVKNPESPYSNSTMCNWLPNTADYGLNSESEYSNGYPAKNGSQLAGDNTLVFHVTKEDHIFTVNGDEYQAKWNKEASAFEVFEVIHYSDDGFSEDGTVYNPNASSYQVKSADNLKAIAAAVNAGDSLEGKTVTLANDIDLSNMTDQVPIGNQKIAFAGIFDGQGYKITGIAMDLTSGYAGLFGNNAGTIKNITIDGSVNVTGSVDFIGGLVGFNSGEIQSIYSTVNVSDGSAYNVGGIAGLNTSGKWVDGSGVNQKIEGATGLIAGCSVDATVTGYNKVGGIVGENAGKVSSCRSAGKVDGMNASSKNGVGGIAGRSGNNNTAYEESVIENCYSTAEVGRAGQKWVGGITGFQNALSSVRNCYFAGSFASFNNNTNNPIVGNNEGSASNNYTLGTIKASGNVEKEVGIKKTDMDMKSAEFVDALNGENGTSFKSSCGYPVLSWETAKEHQETEAVEEIRDATYSEDGAVESVTYCADCGIELKRELIETIDSLKKQAEDAAAVSENAQQEALALAEEAAKATGEAAVEIAEKAKEAAVKAQAAAKAAQTAAQTALEAAQKEGNADAIEEAQAVANSAQTAVDKANTSVETATAQVEKAETGAEAVIDAKDDAIVSLAQLNSLVDGSKYTKSTYAVYADAYKAFEALVNDDTVTAKQVKAARSAVTKAYTGLVEKSNQNLTASAKTASVGFAKLNSAAQNYNLVSASGNQGALSYSKAAGSSAYATVDAKTGKITLAKGAPAGTHTINVAINAAATDNYSAASKTVAAKITVSKADQSMTVKAATKTVKLAKVKKAKQTVKPLTVKNAQGTVTYKKASGSAKLTVNAKTGKVTVKKGTKKGTYKIKVKITAKGNGNYNAKTVTKTIKVKVK